MCVERFWEKVAAPAHLLSLANPSVTLGKKGKSIGYPIQDRRELPQEAQGQDQPAGGAKLTIKPRPPPATFLFICFRFVNMSVFSVSRARLIRQKLDEGFGSLGSGLTEGSEPRCMCWEPNLDFLQE